VADWHWECDPDGLLGCLPKPRGRPVNLPVNLPSATRRSSWTEHRSREYPPGLRIEQRGLLMLTYLTDVRGERIVIVQVTWFD
jgi:hypothetical protein